MIAFSKRFSVVLSAVFFVSLLPASAFSGSQPGQEKKTEEMIEQGIARAVKQICLQEQAKREELEKRFEKKLAKRDSEIRLLKESQAREKEYYTKAIRDLEKKIEGLKEADPALQEKIKHLEKAMAQLVQVEFNDALRFEHKIAAFDEHKINTSSAILHLSDKIEILSSRAKANDRGLITLNGEIEELREFNKNLKSKFFGLFAD